jgi:hypothetical protein
VTNCPKMTASEAVQNQTNDLVNQAPTITTYKTVNKSGMPPRANTIETTAPFGISLFLITLPYLTLPYLTLPYLTSSNIS